MMQEREPFGERPKDAFEGGFRTGAACAVGAKYLARNDINTVGVIGTGRVGRASLMCLSKVRGFDKVIAHSGRRKDENFAREMGKILGVDIIAAEAPEEVARKADVLITATYATEPIIKGEWIREGTHIAAMGADDPIKGEIDAATFKKADKIVIDSEKCLTIGEIANPLKQGILKLEDIYGKIGEVVAGLKPGRENDDEITIFESDGTNIQSASVSWMTYQKVKKLGLGIETSSLASFFINQ
jgi:ornithine cyclodeaminase/alanine dehydrogenase-like protein (mu-crystallin family)